MEPTKAMMDSSDRLHLEFSEKVKKAFGFLNDLGFFEVEASPSLVRKRHDYTEEYKYITEILLRNKIISSEKEVFEGQLYIGLVDLKGSYCCEYLAISKGNFAFIFLHE